MDIQELKELGTEWKGPKNPDGSPDPLFYWRRVVEEHPHQEMRTAAIKFLHAFNTSIPSSQTALRGEMVVWIQHLLAATGGEFDCAWDCAMLAATAESENFHAFVEPLSQMAGVSHWTEYRPR